MLHDDVSENQIWADIEFNIDQFFLQFEPVIM